VKEKGPVIILGAMDGEISAFLENFQILGKQQWKDFTFYPGKLVEKDIVVAKCGVGKVLSAMVTQKMIDLFFPSAIIFTGIAGAIQDHLEIGDILIGEDSVQHDVNATLFNFKRGEIPYTPYRFLKSDPELLHAALDYESQKHHIHKGRILTGDQFINDSRSKEKSYLTQELSGDCVEMEGASVALVATVNQIPHIIIRTISDRADKSSKTNFRKLMKDASANSLAIVKHILKKI
jgi:adenosylhomocysteine nucleosidase